MESFERAKRQSADLAKRALDSKALSALQPEVRTELISATGQELLTSLRSTGATEFRNINDMYAALRGVSIIVRRDSPDRVVELMADQEPIAIDFPEGQRYSNAVEWKPELGSRGLDNAFLEGYGQINGTVTVMGFKKESLDVQSLPDAEQRFAGLDRAYVRSVKGEIRPDDVLFVSVRIPIFAYPEKDMTETELDLLDTYREFLRNGKKAPTFFVQRGFLYTDHLEKQ